MPDYQTQVFQIDGMHCDACVRRLTQALGNLPGVRVQHVEVGRAELMAEPASRPAIQQAVEGAGFTCSGAHVHN